MRVEVVGTIPERFGDAGVPAGDATPALAIKSFLAAIDSDDSLFCVGQPLADPSTKESSSGSVCSGEMRVKFRELENSSNRSLHFLLIEKLIELLKEAGSRETLEATLCLTSATSSASAAAGTAGTEEKPNQRDLAIWIKLSAKADGPDKAVLRWGLGLAHLQQALLFTSRHLRMHLSQASG